MNKHKKLTEEPIRMLIVKMAVPTIVSMLITSFYNMADTFFVGRIGTSATAAVGVALPLMMIIQAIGLFFGQGSGNYISRMLGANKAQEASRMAVTGLFSALAVGASLAVCGLFATPRLAVWLGSTSTIQPYAEQYIFYLFMGMPFMVMSFVLNTQLRLQGNAVYAMIGIGTGAILNIGLDPLLIFTFNLDIAGAAIATSISQAVSFFVLLAGCRRGGSISIKPKDFSFDYKLYTEIGKIGLPSFFRQGLSSLSTILLNLAAVVYGDAAVAAMSIVSRVILFVTSMLLGFGQGFQPVCGFNYGAKRYDRVLSGFWFCVKVSGIGLTALAVMGCLFAPQIIAVFRGDDPDVISIGALALRLQCVTLPLLGWVILCNMLTQNIGAAVSATILSVVRQGLFFVPLILFFPHVMGLWGIQLSQPVASMLSFIVALPLGFGVLNKLKKGAFKMPGSEETMHE